MYEIHDRKDMEGGYNENGPKRPGKCFIIIISYILIFTNGLLYVKAVIYNVHDRKRNGDQRR